MGSSILSSALTALSTVIRFPMNHHHSADFGERFVRTLNEIKKPMTMLLDCPQCQPVTTFPISASVVLRFRQLMAG